MNTFVHFFFFFLFGGPWSESLLLPESELSEDEEEEVEEDELSSSLSLLLSLSSEEELEESLLSDDESLEEPSEPLLLSLESLDLRACGGVQIINKQSELCWHGLWLYLLECHFKTRSLALILDHFCSSSMTEIYFMRWNNFEKIKVHNTTNAALYWLKLKDKIQWTGLDMG